MRAFTSLSFQAIATATVNQPRKLKSPNSLFHAQKSRRKLHELRWYLYIYTQNVFHNSAPTIDHIKSPAHIHVNKHLTQPHPLPTMSAQTPAVYVTFHAVYECCGCRRTSLIRADIECRNCRHPYCDNCQVVYRRWDWIDTANRQR